MGYRNANKKKQCFKVTQPFCQTTLAYFPYRIKLFF
jgi:hypothetical protein